MLGLKETLELARELAKETGKAVHIGKVAGEWGYSVIADFFSYIQYTEFPDGSHTSYGTTLTRAPDGSWPGLVTGPSPHATIELWHCDECSAVFSANIRMCATYLCDGQVSRLATIRVEA